MHVGPDVKSGLSQVLLEGKIKTIIFGRGYAGGDKASVGCSKKGRIWSFHIAADIGEWVEWCHEIGAKLLNNKINVEEILKGALIPEQVNRRPAAR